MIKIPMKTQRHLSTEWKIEIHRKVIVYFSWVLNNFLSAYTCARISNQNKWDIMMSGPASLAVISFIKNWHKKLRLLVDLRIFSKFQVKGHNSQKMRGSKFPANMHNTIWCSIYISSFMINGSVVSEELQWQGHL